MLQLFLAVLSSLTLHAAEEAQPVRKPAMDSSTLAREFSTWADSGDKSILAKACLCGATIDGGRERGTSNSIETVTVSCTAGGVSGHVDVWASGDMAPSRPGELQAFVISLFVGERKFKFITATAQPHPGGAISHRLADARTTLYFQK